MKAWGFLECNEGHWGGVIRVNSFQSVEGMVIYVMRMRLAYILSLLCPLRLSKALWTRSDIFFEFCKGDNRS